MLVSSSGERGEFGNTWEINFGKVDVRSQCLPATCDVESREGLNPVCRGDASALESHRMTITANLNTM